MPTSARWRNASSVQRRRSGSRRCCRDGLTGVWVAERKLASIGVGARHWVTLHGFALNVGADLGGFAHITPCGSGGVEMTSIAPEIGGAPPPSVEEMGALVLDQIRHVFAAFAARGES
ncbi:MAG: hypothetical protein R3F11_27250 [Verrucomicrobiales bacterium]